MTLLDELHAFLQSTVAAATWTARSRAIGSG
jgi:hypothetical protein